MGCVVLGIGIFAMVDGAALVDLVNNSGTDVSVTIFTSAPIILIVVSVFVIIITFFGCCGAIKENRCMLGTYFTIILVLFIVMIVGAVVGYSQSMAEIEKAVTKTMEFYKDDPTASGVDSKSKAITEAWDAIQGQDAVSGSIVLTESGTNILLKPVFSLIVVERTWQRITSVG